MCVDEARGDKTAATVIVVGDGVHQNSGLGTLMSAPRDAVALEDHGGTGNHAVVTTGEEAADVVETPHLDPSRIMSTTVRPPTTTCVMSRAEQQKIKCGERHFVGALGVDFAVVTNADDLKVAGAKTG